MAWQPYKDGVEGRSSERFDFDTLLQTLRFRPLLHHSSRSLVPNNGHSLHLSIKMKSFVAILALPALFVSTLAAPSASNGISFEKRQASGAFGLVSSLFTEVQKGTGSISACFLTGHSNRPPSLTNS